MNPLRKRAVIDEDSCVACGCCTIACPLDAIKIYKGIYAVVEGKCVGCGKCKSICPASVIQMEEKA